MKVRLALLLPCLLTISQVANAQWVQNGTPVTVMPNAQDSFQSIPDGSGGVIIAWADLRSGSSVDIYAQKLDAYGVPKWTLDGVAVCALTNEQNYPAVCSDGAGGCIIAWSDYRSGAGSDIWAQRINAAGTAQWAANGVLISNPPIGGDQWNPCIVADGAGGAIIAWQDSRNGPDDIYAQRVNATGVVQWAAHGKSVSVATGAQQQPVIVTDGANGAIITWMDYRSGTSYDIYAQRMSSSGGPQWLAGGVPLCTADDNQAYPKIVSDGAGGAIITWHDLRSGSTWDVHAQRVSSAGTALWAVSGVAVCSGPGNQANPVITTDGANGAIIAWEDDRSGDNDVYIRRVTAAGLPVWQYTGVPVCTQPGYQSFPRIDSDGAGGAVLSWNDTRAVQSDAFAQRIDRNGVNVWDFDGVAVCDRQEEITFTQVVWSSGSGIVVWGDTRTAEDDIFAQRVDARFGSWGHPEPTVTSVADVRADQGGHVKVNWKASDHDALGYAQVIMVMYYTIWRATDAAALAAAPSTLVLDDLAGVREDFTGKMVYVQHAAATDYYWEMVGTQSALKIPAYSFTAETRADSVLGNAATHHFMVAAHGNEYVHWPSNEMSGRSVDNLAPAAPLFLSGYRAGSSVVLKWNRVRVPDLRDYSVYRKTSSGVTPIDPNYLSSTDDSTLVDTNAPATTLYYIVTANDVHANRSAASNEASVSSSTGAGGMPDITGVMVMQNRPNPFAGRATFDVGLPAASRVDMEVFDIAGRRVASRSFGMKPAGWQQIALDALDDAGSPLPSGVYFYRVRAAGQTITHKMVIAR